MQDTNSGGRSLSSGHTRPVDVFGYCRRCHRTDVGVYITWRS